MASHRTATFVDTPYTDPNPLPSTVPHVDELGVTSAPLKSASFFIGQHCKDVNGALQSPTAADKGDRYIGMALEKAVIEMELMWNRRLYALQSREPGPGALLERRAESDTMCSGSVSLL